MNKRRTLLIKISGLNVGDVVPNSWFKKDATLNKLIISLSQHRYLIRAHKYKYYVIKEVPMNIRHKDLGGKKVDTLELDKFLYDYWITNYTKEKGDVIPLFHGVLRYLSVVIGGFYTEDVCEALPHCNRQSVMSYLSHFKSAGIITKRHGVMYVDTPISMDYLTITDVVNEGNARRDKVVREIAKSSGQDISDESKVRISELQDLARKAGLIK